MTPLERMYPRRCYDCLAPLAEDTVLCPKCEAGYAEHRARQTERTRQATDGQST